MDEILRVARDLIDGLQSVANLVDQEVNEDAAELRRAHLATTANVYALAQAAAQLRDARAGLTSTAAAPRPRHPDDDGD